MLNKVGIDLANTKDISVKNIYYKDKSGDITQYYNTFSVNPYICKLCGRKGFANELVLCDQQVGVGENIICEECALKSNINIKDYRGVFNFGE